jgi:hypothetical protein
MFAKLKNEPEKSPNARLMEAMCLSDEDIALNRAGEISPLQKERMDRAFFWQCLFAGGVLLFIGALIISSVQTNVPVQARASNPLTWILSAGVLIALGIAGKFARTHFTNMAAGRAIAFTGRVRKHAPSSTGKNAPPPLLIVIDYQSEQERIFEVNDGSYNAYIEGQTYTIYSPSFNEKKIIAAEHVPEDSKRK